MHTWMISNPTRGLKSFFDGIAGRQKLVTVRPGETIGPVELASHASDVQRAIRNSLILTRVETTAPVFQQKPMAPGEAKRPLIVVGMWGIGDNLHQRAVIRELMKTRDVWLETCQSETWHDLVEQGLKLVFRTTHWRTQIKIVEREKGFFPVSAPHPSGTEKAKLWYYKQGIDQHGSLLGAMLGCFDLKPARPDFSFPLKPEWRAAARQLVAGWDMGGKPLLVYRPIVLRREWDSENRNPDPAAYAAIFAAIREQFFVVSIADLQDGEEWIVGPEQEADVKLHRGELQFGTMAALFAEAKLIYCNAGMAPVLAQAVGAPSIVVYGGRESFRTTQAAGAHLARTLGIDPDRPCDCHTNRHNCDKRITLEPAIARARAFTAETLAPQKAKTLIFGTTYVDCKERFALTNQWMTLVTKLNHDCDVLIVDAHSPWPSLVDEDRFGKPEKYKTGVQAKFMAHIFNENVGHLSRGGNDGWGRAFTFGLQAAIDCGYEYVVHIEGDSLFRLPVTPIVADMARSDRKALSIPVLGTTVPLVNWVETGLMFFKTSYIAESGFIARYDWQHRKVRPTPEVVVREILGSALTMMNWKGLRGDKQQVTEKNIASLDLDWVTHCHNDIFAYDRFVERALAETDGREVMQIEGNGIHPIETPPAVKLNFGCGTNHLDGWRNMDIDVDIEKPLPFDDASADFIFAEHCVEHVDYWAAIRFFREAFRVLKPGGVIRIAVPSVERVMKFTTPEYAEFTTKWQPDASVRGAMTNILYKHGHKAAWTDTLLGATIFYAGFEDVASRRPGESAWAELRSIEGHGTVIGDEFNRIETIVCEAVKPGADGRRFGAPAMTGRPLAVVVGGSSAVFEEVAKAVAFLNGYDGPVTWLVTNSMIAKFPSPLIAVTLHPNALEGWLSERRANGWAPPRDVWAHRPAPGVTRHLEEWRGSSGLFAVKIARELGFERILLCGVPMDAEAQHFIRKERWNAAFAFRKGWEQHKGEIAPYVRSFSGWTAEMFGKPDKAFLA